MAGYDPEHKGRAPGYSTRRIRKTRKPPVRARSRSRLGGGGLPDIINPRTRRFELGRVLKPDRKS